MAAPSLSGWTVGVTADRRSGEQIELLVRRGARVVHGPTIRTIALHENQELRTATRAIIDDPPDIVVLTTGLGVRAWFDAADALGLGDALVALLNRATVVARGPKAAGAALTAGIGVAWQAPSGRSDELVDHLANAGVAGARVAVQLDGRAEPVLATQLRERGAHVVAVPVYRWLLPEDDAPARRLVEAACEGQLDAVTFTSAPALANVLDIAGRMCARGRLVAAFADGVGMVSIGSVCSEAARSLGVAPVVQPARQRLGAMVMALARYASDLDAAAVARVGPRRVVLRASAVVVDDHVVELSAGERALLDALLGHPGVVSKAALLRRAWPADTVDEHAVEVAVARLRRRLDGWLHIATVPRRGYRLTAT